MNRRGGAVTALLSVLVVTVVVAALVVGSADTAPALALPASGHWLYDRVAGAVFHIDGGTRQVDARVAVPDAGAVSMTLQGTDRGFLVAAGTVTPFDKSTLTVDSSFAVPGSELPVGIETTGGPYLVYRRAGTVVRLGATPTTIQVGGPISSLTSTDSGALWLRRTDTGSLCAITATADSAACVATAPPAHRGAVTTVGAAAAFADLDDDTLTPLDERGAGTARPLGTDLPVDALLSDHDAAGRLAAITPADHRLVLVDARGALAGAAAPVIAVPLAPGHYAPPTAGPTVVVVLDTTSGVLSTFSPTGVLLGSAELGPGAATAQLLRGTDGNVYVDDPAGGRTHAVAADGSIAAVATTSDVPVAVAAPAALRVTTRPPPLQTVSTRPVTGPAAPGPPPSGGPAPGPPGGGGNAVPACRIPGPPPGVVATADPKTGGLSVTWQPAAADGCPVTGYVVTSGGATKTVTGTSTTVAGTTPGTPVTVRVAAESAAGQGPDATAAATPIAPAAAPTNLLATRSGCDPARVSQGLPYCYPTIATLTWGRPDLGGGALDHYLVTVTQPGHATVTKAVTTMSATSSSATDFDQCARVTMTVRAVTREKGRPDGAPVTGAAATTAFQDADCTPDADITSATPNGDRAVAVTYREVFSEKGTETATCRIDFSGVPKLTQQCPFDRFAFNQPSHTVDISGLAYATTYDVTITISSPYGTKTSAAVPVRTNDAPAGGG